jgi:hypothetical protein
MLKVIKILRFCLRSFVNIGQEYQSLLCVTPEVVEDLVQPGGVTFHERIGGDEVFVLLHKSVRSLHHRLKYLFPDSRI